MTPIVLVPGLLCTAEVFAPQIVALWPHGPVTIASTLEGRTIAEIAAAILDAAPPQFALAGISMGGYISFEMMRQAPERISRLALLGTSARPDTPIRSHDGVPRLPRPAMKISMRHWHRSMTQYCTRPSEATARYAQQTCTWG